MQRRDFILTCTTGIAATVLVGCRGRQYAHVLEADDKDMVGSHTAGAETWKPLVTESVGRLLARDLVHQAEVTQAGYSPGKRRICFVGVENKSAEELFDFKDQIYVHVDSCLSQGGVFTTVSRRFVDAGLEQCRMRPDELFIPSNRRAFTAALEQMEQPFDFLLFATITSGTTTSNENYQRDYLLTLELVDLATGSSETESASLRKGYHKTVLGRMKHYGG